MKLHLLKFMLMGCLLTLAAGAECQTYAQEREFKLAAPVLRTEAVFFQETTSVEIALDVERVTIRYTIDGTAPTNRSPLYSGKIDLKETSLIRAKAFHEHFLPSDIVDLAVHKLGSTADFQLEVTPEPSESYPGNGTSGLIDRVKGSANFRDGEWLGFSADTITMKVEFDDAIDVPIMNLSVLEDQGSWIFLPKSVEVWVKGEQVTLWEKDRLQDQPKSFQYIQFTIPRRKLKEATIRMVMDKIPEWHPGKGTIPWFFIDEVFIQN